MIYFIKSLLGLGGKDWVNRMTHSINVEAEQMIRISDAVVSGSSTIALLVNGVVVDWVGRESGSDVVCSADLLSMLRNLRQIEVNKRMETEGVNAELARIAMHDAVNLSREEVCHE